MGGWVYSDVGGCVCVGMSHLMMVPIAPPLEVVMTRETRALWRSSSSSRSILHAREKKREEPFDMVLISSGRGRGGITYKHTHTHRMTDRQTQTHTRTHTTHRFGYKELPLTFVILGVLIKGDVPQVQDGCRQVHEVRLLIRCHPNAVHGHHHHLEATDVIQRPIISGLWIQILQVSRVTHGSSDGVTTSV